MWYRTFLTMTSVLVVATCLAWGATASAHDASGGMVKTSGPYTIQLHLLPAESFVSQAQAKMAGNAGDMVNGQGASPVRKDGPEHPNHHLVVFIKKHGQPVEDADVQMRYQPQGASGQMTALPVTRMWVAGKGMQTTHYGNNVHLAPGRYVVQVTVDNAAPVRFNVTVQ